MHLCRLKTTKNFTTAHNKMCEKYGEEFELINGLHETQMNYGDFIDNFTKDNSNVADSTIDANANVSSKDIQALLKEKGKPHDKLLAFNKIFYEIQKKYGIQTAREWYELEFGPYLYMHDAPSASYFSYCYKGEEMVTITYNGVIHNLALKELYNIVPEEYVKYDASINQMAKFPENLYIQDISESGEKCWTKVYRVVAHQNSKKMRFIKYANGLSHIVTEDHPIITENGETPAKDVTTDDRIFSTKPDYFTNSIKEVQTKLTAGQIYNKFYDGLGVVPLTKDIGWIIGMFLSEGSCNINQAVTIVQSPGPQLDKLASICEKYNIAYSIRNHEKGYNIQNFVIKSSPLAQWIKTNFAKQVCDTKRLPTNYIHYSFDFLDGVVAGMIDGDGTIDGYKHRHCQIRITSEILCHQLSNYLSTKNVFCGDRTPFRYKRQGSFEQKLPMFGIGFTLTNEDYFLNIGSIKVNSTYEPRIKTGNFMQKKYQFNYDWVNIIENVEYIDDCPIVYDITTDTGHFICNNVLSHNCYAYDLSRLATEGLFFMDNYNNEPPKHLQTFLDDAIEYISYMSNRSSGAVGLPDIIIWMFYFWHHDVENNYFLVNPEYYLKQAFQKLIFRLNQKFYRDQTQTVFSNMSIFDRIYLEELFGGREYPDGTYVIDYIEEIMDAQKLFMEVVSETRSSQLFTYPVKLAA